MSIKFVKLDTGEEFFSTVTRPEDDSTSYQMTNSVVAIDNGSGGLSFIPYLPFVASRTFRVDQEDVMILEDVIEEIKNTYKSAFGSKIITPSEKKIITG